MKLPSRQSAFIEYGGAVALVAAGLVVQRVINSALDEHISFQFMLLIVAVCARFFTLPPTLFAILLAGLAQPFFFLAPRGSFFVLRLGEAIEFALFILVSLVIAFLTDRLKRSHVANEATLRELIKSNRARQVSEHRLDAGLNNMIDPIMMLLPRRDEGGTVSDLLIEYVNEPAALLNGPEPRVRQIGQTLSMAAPNQVSRGLIDTYARVLEKDDTVEAPILMSADTNGTARDYEIRASRLGEGLVVHWRDVTDHRRAQHVMKQSEERYRSLVQAIGAIVWSTPASGEFETPQLEWSVFTGQTFDQLRGWGWLDAVHPDDRRRTAEVWREAVRRCTNYEAEHRLRRADGEYRHMIVRGVPILGARGEVREWVGVHTDITDRRRAEQIIADSERQLRRVLNAMYTFVGVLTPDGTLVGVNESPLRAAGITAAEVIGKKFWDCHWWNYSESIQKQLIGWVVRVQKGEVVREDVAVLMQQKQTIFIDFMLAPMRDEHGDITHLIASGVDVSERKRVQAELADRERHYRQLIEGLPMMSWTTNAEGECDYLSQRWAEYTGKSIVSQLAYGWLGVVHPDDQERLTKQWAHSVRTGEPMSIEFRLRRHDGEYRWHDTRAEPMRDAQGRVVRWFGTNMDLHDRRRAEQRFRRLYESNLAGIVFYHYDGTVSDPNDAFYTLLGYDEGQERPTRLSWRELTPPEWEGVDNEQWKQLNEFGRCGPFEKEFYRVDGARVPVMIAAADLEPGHHDFGVAYVIDMTRVKRVEEALRQTEANLRMVNESLEHRIHERTLELQHRSDQLRALALDLTETESRERKRLAQILHDHFQQLVSAAKLKVGIIRRKLTDPALIETVKQVESLLEETINASRSLATELSPPVLHDAGLEAAFDWLGRRMEKDHNLHVTVKYDASCEPDNEQVQTILFECTRELLFNVVKHSGCEHAQLSVSTPHEGLLQVTVSDEGSGFDAQGMEMKQKPDGSFGLFSIRERLGLLGGLVRVESEPGRGTSVQMTVPVSLRSPERGASNTPLLEAGDSQAGGRSSSQRVPNVRVLVADDHRLFREGLISLISQETFVEIVGQANDGEEAVMLARQLKPDILIVDVTMPKLNGVQVTAQLSKDMPELKVIGLSMHERDDMANAMRDAGAVAYCTKGGPTETLLSVLRNVALTNRVSSR
jgi:PAS domain S-box-containing protein